MGGGLNWDCGGWDLWDPAVAGGPMIGRCDGDVDIRGNGVEGWLWDGFSVREISL